MLQTIIKIKGRIAKTHVLSVLIVSSKSKIPVLELLSLQTVKVISELFILNIAKQLSMTSIIKIHPKDIQALILEGFS
jgi:ribosomal protein L10